MKQFAPASPFPSVSGNPKARAGILKKPPAKRSSTSEQVGLQIHTLRSAAGMTASALATASGVSRSMLSRIERGLVSPSIEVLEKISQALDVPMSRFFVDQTRRLDMSLVRAGMGLKIERTDAIAGYTYELLGHLLSGNLFIEPYLVTLDENARPYTAFQHPGMKFIYMLSGRMQYRYSHKLMEIGPGDSLLYDARAMHGAEVLHEGPIQYLSIVFTIRD